MQLRSISWTLFIINNNKNLRQLSYTFSELYENIGLTVARMKVREFSLLRKTKNKSKVKMMKILGRVMKSIYINKVTVRLFVCLFVCLLLIIFPIEQPILHHTPLHKSLLLSPRLN